MLLVCWAVFGANLLYAQHVVDGPFLKHDVPIPDGGDVRLNAYPPTAEAFIWSNGWQTPSIFVDSAGWYWVDVVVNGKVQRDSIHLHHGPPCIMIPSAISGNSDVEPCFRLGTLCGADSVWFRVFSKWGTLLYETQRPVECWRGTSNDVPLESGVYIYILEWALNRGSSVRRNTGTITVVR